MEIGLCSYQKGTNNKWTYNLRNYLMVDLNTIIALASMTYIVDIDAYELHLGDEKIFNNFSNESQGFTLYMQQGFIIIQKYICILMLMTIYECIFFLHIHIVTCIFIIEIVHVWFDVTNENLYIGEF